MICSEPFPLTYKRRPARLWVIRNNGYCWGRLVTADKQELDVSTAFDQYDKDDDAAAETFIRAAKRGRVEPAVGWLGFPEY